MIGYASRTGTKKNLAALREHGWRLLVSAMGPHRNEGFPYAIDNGAWSAYTQGKPFNEPMFIKLLASHGGKADWVALPDIVAGGHASLEFSLRWMRRVLDESPRALLPVQDGVSRADIEPFLGDRVGVFVGGSTKWKLESLPTWGGSALVGSGCTLDASTALGASASVRITGRRPSTARTCRGSRRTS